MDSIPIPNRQKIHVLGVHFASMARNTTAVSHLIAAANQLSLMIRRVISKNHGMKETKTTKWVEVFVVSRYAYVVPFLSLKPKEKDRLDRALRDCIKPSLGLPHGSGMQMHTELRRVRGDKATTQEIHSSPQHFYVVDNGLHTCEHSP